MLEESNQFPHHPSGSNREAQLVAMLDIIKAKLDNLIQTCETHNEKK